MEDVLEGIIIPHWSIGSVLLMLLTIAAVAASILTLIQIVLFVFNKLANTLLKSSLVLLILTSSYRGYLYYRAISFWIYTVLRISTTPSLEVLNYGRIIQEDIALEIVRAMSHVFVFTISYLLLKKANLDGKQGQP